jgi:hypothetical protein
MSRKELIRQYGVEIFLKCSCGEIPSHFMEGRTPRCPVCKEVTNIVAKKHDDYYNSLDS